MFLDEQKVVRDILSKCANPQCRKPFLRLCDGKLFLVETDRTTKRENLPSLLLLALGNSNGV